MYRNKIKIYITFIFYLKRNVIISAYKIIFVYNNIKKSMLSQRVMKYLVAFSLILMQLFLLTNQIFYYQIHSFNN